MSTKKQAKPEVSAIFTAFSLLLYTIFHLAFFNTNGYYIDTKR